MRAAGLTGGYPWPPVFPYSVAGMPDSTCTCTWAWDYDQGKFTKTTRGEHCIWCALEKAAMANAEAGTADPTTIQVSRAQRAAIASIQADLITASGRHVTTKETISTMIDFWKENHHADPA